MFRVFFGLFICLNSINLTGQSDFRIHLGLNASLGLPINRIGVSLQADYQAGWVALNSGIQIYLNGTNYGPKGSYLEGQFFLGAWLAYGAPKAASEIFHPMVAPTSRQYGVGYQLNRYQDNRQTSQWTGTVKLKFGSLYFQTENDAFAPGKPKDRFRSGGASFIWVTNHQIFELRTVLWHGDSGGEAAESIRDTDYPCRFGIRDFTECDYGHYSNGVLALQVHQQLEFGQIAQFGVGVDAEQVRNIVQNTLIHDMWFFPKGWTTVRNLHYPMLTPSGELYLFQEGQEIRSPQPYFQLGLNAWGYY